MRQNKNNIHIRFKYAKVYTGVLYTDIVSKAEESPRALPSSRLMPGQQTVHRRLNEGNTEFKIIHH